MRPPEPRSAGRHGRALEQRALPGRKALEAAASRAWIEGGISMAARSAAGDPALPDAGQRAVVARSMRTSSVTKRGLPSLAASTRPVTAAGSASAPTLRPRAAPLARVETAQREDVVGRPASRARGRGRGARDARPTSTNSGTRAPLHDVFQRSRSGGSARACRPLEDDRPPTRERGEQPSHGEEGPLGGRRLAREERHADAGRPDARRARRQVGR